MSILKCFKRRGDLPDPERRLSKELHGLVYNSFGNWESEAIAKGLIWLVTSTIRHFSENWHLEPVTSHTRFPLFCKNIVQMLDIFIVRHGLTLPKTGRFDNTVILFSWHKCLLWISSNLSGQNHREVRLMNNWSMPTPRGWSIVVQRYEQYTHVYRSCNTNANHRVLLLTYAAKNYTIPDETTAWVLP